MPSFALDSLRSYFHSTGRALAALGAKHRALLDLDDPRSFYLPPRPYKKTQKHKSGKKKPKREKISVRDFAIRLLQAGAEVEQSLLVQYLYAAYSIDERKGNLESNKALEWKTAIRLVAREEMAHLITVQNLLLTLGAGIHIDRGSMNRADLDLPLPFSLERLSRDSVAKYVLFESPSPSQIDKKNRKIVHKIREGLGNKARVRSVGSIYAALYWLFMESDVPDSGWPFSQNVVSKFIRRYGRRLHLKDKHFVARAKYSDRAASVDEWEVFERDAHVDEASPRDTALAGLRWIMAQGEGPNAIEDSHFNRFLTIYKNIKRYSKSPKAVMLVPANPRIPSPRRGKRTREHGTAIGNPRSRAWGELVNARYQLMILHIYRALNSSKRRAEEERRKFAAFALAEMEFVKRIGQILPFMDLNGQRKKKSQTSSGKKSGRPLVAGAVFEEVRVPLDETARLKACRKYIYTSDRCIADLAGVVRKTGTHVPHPLAENSIDLPALAQGPQLLEAIARQNDVIRETLDLQ
jgi:hypothetical protein